MSLLAAGLGLSLVAFGAGGVRAQEPPAAREQRPLNHLAGETSPYLLQHAQNPVDWYPWGPGAFAKAKREGKPVFLSIGYSSCHWCHVMERESFEDEGVAKLLNDHFVAIKVDREERPDIDEIYMTAVQMMTGRGGWPMSTFLTPDGKPFFGGTYFPRDPFADLLRKVHEVWSDPEKRQQLETQADRVAKALGEAATAPKPGSLSPNVLRPAAEKLLEDLDLENGGFGGAPKFPPAGRLSLLLAEHRRRPDPKLLRAVTLTLDRMARGGMYDQVGGGFHRYSTDAKWLVPHFEKMLYDNALLAAVYLDAFRVTRDPEYRRVATETLDFCLRELRDSKGGFWSTLDADSPGGEGRFYTWTPSEVAGVLGPADGALFCRVYDITSSGNFEGRSIPNRIAKPLDAWAKELKASPAALRTRLDRMRERLRAARAKRPRPALDDKVLASWNGLMLRALALAYDATGEERFRRAAEETAAFLLGTMHVFPSAKGDGPRASLVHSYRRGRLRVGVFLEDYAYVLAGLLELHRATGERRWLEATYGLVPGMLARFWDDASGTLASTPVDHERLLVRLANAEDGATPSAPAMAAESLVRLARLTGNREWGDRARRLLETYAEPARRYPAAMTGMLLATAQYFAAEPTAPARGGKASVTLLRGPAAIRPGVPFDVTLRLSVAKGWHVNSSRPSDPALVPTRVELLPGPFRLDRARYPAAQTLAARFSEKPLSVYSGNGEIRLTLTPLPGAGKTRSLRLRVRYQACNDRTCDRPASVEVPVPVQ